MQAPAAHERRLPESGKRTILNPMTPAPRLLNTLQATWFYPDTLPALAPLFESATPDERLEATRYLISQGCREGSQGKRSGLRSALHLWHASGIEPDGEALELLWENVTRSSLRTYAVASDPQVPALVLVRLARQASQSLASALLANDTTPLEVLEIFVQHPEFIVRNAVAMHAKASADLLEILSEDEDYLVRLAAFENPNLPPEKLEKRQERQGLMLMDADFSADLSPATLRDYAESDDSFKQLAAVMHPDPPPDVLERLLKSPDKVVRLSLTGKPNIGNELLFKLLEDENRDIADIALRRLSRDPGNAERLTAFRARHASYYDSLELAQNPDTSPETLRRLSYDRDDSMCRSVAENPNTPADVLDRFSQSDKSALVYEIIRHPNTTPDTLWRLAQNKSGPYTSVRSRLKERPNVPLELLRYLLHDPEAYVRERSATSPQFCLEEL